MVFAGYSGFLHYLQLASHELALIGLNVTKKRNFKFKHLIKVHGMYGVVRGDWGTKVQHRYLIYGACP